MILKGVFRKRKPLYPVDRRTLRPCLFCSFDTTDHIKWIEHMQDHTAEEKALLTVGDIHRLINILSAILKYEIRKDANTKCCEFKDCLHNFENPHQQRLRVIINKLRNYDFKGKNGTFSIAAIPDTDFLTRLSEEMDMYQNQRANMQPYQYRAFFYKVQELCFMLGKRFPRRKR